MRRRITISIVTIGILGATIATLSSSGGASPPGENASSQAFADELARIRAGIRQRTVATIEEMRELRAFLSRIPAQVVEKYGLSRAAYMDVYDAHLRAAYNELRELWPELFEATQPTIRHVTD
jgi:hypothetical protein